MCAAQLQLTHAAPPGVDMLLPDTAPAPACRRPCCPPPKLPCLSRGTRFRTLMTANTTSSARLTQAKVHPASLLQQPAMLLFSTSVLCPGDARPLCSWGGRVKV